MEQPDYSKVLWNAAGSPYWATPSGGKVYITPAVAMSMFDDPRALSWARSKGFYIDGGRAGLNQTPTVDASGHVTMPANPVHGSAPGGGIFHTTGTWNGETGQWDQGLDWGNIMALSIGGLMAAPAVAAIAGGGAAAGGAGAAGVGATGSTVPVIGTLPAVGASGAVPAALGAGAGAGGWGTAAAIGKAALGVPSAGGGGMSYLSWLGPAINAGTSIYGAIAQSNANKDALATQAETSKYAADLNAKAQAEALAFQRQLAESQYQTGETDRNANYGQWAAAQRRLGIVGDALGLGPREIPAYVPGVDPRFTGGGSQMALGGGQQAAGAAPRGLPQIDPSKPIGPQAEAYIRSMGGTPNPTSAGYWQSKWPELVARGQEIGDPQYALKRLAAADELGGGEMSAAPAVRTAPLPANYGSIGSLLQYKPLTVSPGVQMSYQPGSFGSYLR